MPRAIWKGSLSFGLLNIPVSLYPAERKYDISFHLLDSRDQARVRYERVNEETGEEVPWDKIVRGYEFDGQGYVLLTDADFEKVRLETTHTIEVQSFVDADKMDVRYYDKPYYLEPAKGGERAYVLLREVLRRTNRTGIAKVVIRTKEHLAALLPCGEALVLDLIRWDQEVRRPDELQLPAGDLEKFHVREAELEMAKALIEAMTAEWNPSRYKDDYRERLLAWIEEKGRTRAEPVAPREKETGGGKVIDMMAVLQASVEAARKGKDEANGTKPDAKKGKTTRGKEPRRKAG